MRNLLQSRVDRKTERRKLCGVKRTKA
jgi:hypothetical protein